MRRFLLLLLVPAFAACSPSATPTATQPDSTLPPPAPISPQAAVTPTLPAGTATPTDSVPQPASFADPANYTWNQVAGGLVRPVDIQNPGDGSGRLFILEQAGRILVYQNGSLLPAPFLDIRAKVGSSGNEQGLLGLAFHPQYQRNGLFFINYTDTNGDTVIAKYKVSSDPNVADAGSESVLLSVDQPFQNHNGGALVFGPDGFLYAGLGDGGSAGDPFGNAQNTSALLGKILRLDVDAGDPFAIPPGNPFGNEVWDYGLRNPWRFSFDRLTGDLYIGDVGQDEWEEIDFLPAGSPGGTNFGWNLMEGSHPYGGNNQPEFTAPVAEYGHSETGGCSVTGGYVYRGQALPEWQGIYFYGDYCSGEIWGLLHSASQWENRSLFKSGFNISSFGVDENGELYLADLNGGIYRLEKK